MRDSQAVRLPRAWNARPTDFTSKYGCDALNFANDDVYYRAIDVRAPPELTFRWLCQLRAAPYSYDLLDNFARKSPPHLTPGLDRLAPGQRMMTIFEIVAFEPQREITARLRSRFAKALMGDFAGSYAAVPTSDGSRIVAKIVVRYPRGISGALLRLGMPWLDLIMFRKQLLTLRTYIERDARATKRSRV